MTSSRFATPELSARTDRDETNAETPGYNPRLVLKFRDNVEIPYGDEAAEALDRFKIGPWSRVAERYPGLRLRPMFTSVKPDRIRQLTEQGRERDSSYVPPNFLTFFLVDLPAHVKADEVVKELAEWRTVETVYFDPPGDEPAVNALDDPRSPNQGYLDPAPDGIDAEFAWGVTGGDGAGQNVIDLERGWTLAHEDLTAHGATLLHGTLLDTSRPHGTSVLGEICASDNVVGCVGIAPNVSSVNVVSYNGSTRPNAIMAAIANLPFGGVLLLEAQLSTTIGATFWTNVPIEVLAAEFATIRLATALGITVIEAAGNGSNDLDTFTDAMGNPSLNRGSPFFRDSGAVMVAAGSSTAPHTPMFFTNFGSRIDCYGWGENVDTTSSTTTTPFSINAYTGTFNGTSSASPIITGAALSIQGIAEASLGYRFSAYQLRAMLANPATGTASNNPAVDRIGVMPNLQAIINGNAIGVAPDVYLRDFVGDVGDPHSGPISVSPDIIVRPAPVADPTASFGAGSGTENSDTLGDTVESGQNNYVYVRVWNRGGSAAANVTARVYWAPVATLLTPDLWTLVGSVVLPSVPAGNVLTVSSAITWPAAQVPAPGHYCFVGLIGNAADPAPQLADFMRWTNFETLIRDNNNVTWRNFNVVDNVPDPHADPAGFVALPFLAPGALDRGRRMRLEVIARLPKGARVMLEIPLAMFEGMTRRDPAKVDEKRQMARIPMNPHGVRGLDEMLFPAKSKQLLRVLVRIPEENRKSEYDIAVRQLYENHEVGRVTWRLSPKAKAKQANNRKGKGER